MIQYVLYIIYAGSDSADDSADNLKLVSISRYLVPTGTGLAVVTCQMSIHFMAQEGEIRGGFALHALESGISGRTIALDKLKYSCKSCSSC